MATPAAKPPTDHPELGPDPIAERLARTFRSARLYYRGIEQNEADEDLIFRIKSDPDPAISSSDDWPRPYTREQAKAFIPVLQQNLITAIIEIDTSEPPPRGDGVYPERLPKRPSSDPLPVPKERFPIGMVSLRPCTARDMTQSRVAELSIDLLAGFQGRGYGSEAMRWILNWAFEMAALHRVRLCCASWNTKALRAYEAVGFKRAGVEEEMLWCAGRWWDMITYGILDREWAQVQEERKAKELRA